MILQELVKLFWGGLRQLGKSLLPISIKTKTTPTHTGFHSPSLRLINLKCKVQMLIQYVLLFCHIVPSNKIFKWLFHLAIFGFHATQNQTLPQIPWASYITGPAKWYFLMIIKLTEIPLLCVPLRKGITSNMMWKFQGIVSEFCGKVLILWTIWGLKQQQVSMNKMCQHKWGWVEAVESTWEKEKNVALVWSQQQSPNALPSPHLKPKLSYIQNILE